MRVLLDTCVWGGTRKQLQDAGHDVIWAGDWPDDPGDDEILERARAEQRVLVTLDKDFGHLVVVQRRPHAGIIRLVDFRARDQAAACRSVLATHGEELLAGALLTVEPGRLRIRPPEGA